MKRGSSILIHSATGGIGLAALNICVHYKCDIYVTVGTQEKRDYLKKRYRQIPDSHFGNSHDGSFEEMIKKETRGRGVDIVLNSLSEDKLKASVRCLARGGSLLEIGKFDLANNTTLNMMLLEKDIGYHGVMLDQIFAKAPELKLALSNIISTGIKDGFIQPLPSVVFEKDQVEQAFRHMTSGKHIGKVLIRLRDEEKQKVILTPKTLFRGMQRFNCHAEKSYIIIGGLGGIGLELASWLVVRGCTKLILVSRTGIQTGYQTQRLGILRSYGAEILVSTEDVTTKQGCYDMIKDASEIGPVDAIFNLAALLEDALFENQTENKFQTALAPKAQVTKNLDQVTRKTCPHLRYFVVFSSVSCGRGNPGQSNYGMANSIMERICERRKLEGLPAVAIQWGAIGDVGLVAKMQKENKELVIGGTLQQKISSCLEVLDTLLKQDFPIVGSMVVAEKHNRNYDTGNVVDAVAYVLGIKDIKTISQHATLAELGMDSMMGTEVIQRLEKDFDIYITAKEVRSLTFAKLIEIEAEKKTSEGQEVNKTELGTKYLIKYIPDSKMNSSAVVRLSSKVKEGEEAPTVLIFCGIEGVFLPLEPLAKNLQAHVIGIHYSYKNPEDSIQETARTLLPHIEACLPSKDKAFSLIGYSFGAAVALEITNMLEAKRYNLDKLFVIDGSPSYLASSVKDYLPSETEEEFQTVLIYKILSTLLPMGVLQQTKEKFMQCQSFEERVDLAVTMIPSNIVNKQKLEKQAALTLYKRFKAVLRYSYEHDKIKSPMHLFKAKHSMVTDEEPDYKLSSLCGQPVQVTVIDGDHATILDRIELSEAINKML